MTNKRNFGVFYSNRTEQLVDALAESLSNDSAFQDIFTTPTVIVPNWNLARHLKFELSQRFGVSGDYFSTVETFLSEAAKSEVGFVNQTRLVSEILKLIKDDSFLNQPDMKAVKEYLSQGETLPGKRSRSSIKTRSLRSYQLARRVANNFMQYGHSRLEMINTWRREDDIYTEKNHYQKNEIWQKRLWEELFDGQGRLVSGDTDRERPFYLLTEYFRDVDVSELNLPEQVHMFGLSHFAPVYGQIFENISESITVKCFTINPCREYWEDVIYDQQEEILEGRSLLEGRQSEAVDAGVEEETWDLDAESPLDPPLALTAWGRAGRDLTHLLNRLSGYEFGSHWVDPADNGENNSLLEQFQSDVLNFRTANQHSTKHPPDDSVRFLSCPSIRREVEVVADEIWNLVTDDINDVSFEDIAVIVNPRKRDEYQARIETVFEQVRDIPFNEIDIKRGDTSQLMEGIESLLRLPTQPFNRSNILSILLHPNFDSPFSDTDREQIEQWVDRLAIFQGADSNDLTDTYIEEDLFNWDQGIKRLVLGTYMEPSQQGEFEVEFTIGQNQYRPEEVKENYVDTLASFIKGVRGLVSAARSVQDDERSLTEWFGWMSLFIRNHMEPAESAQEPEFYSYLNTLQDLADLEGGPEAIGYETAVEFALDELSNQEYEKGHYLASGVVVSSFQPQRPIPFKVVFMLGMNEGDFPASSPRSPIDLHTDRWQEGDLWDRDRERYMFLETVLSTRQQVNLSWVSREPVTGEDLEPSSVFREFQRIMDHYLEDDTNEDPLLVEHPLRRYDSCYFPDPNPESNQSTDHQRDELAPTFHPQAIQEANAQLFRNQVLKENKYMKTAQLSANNLSGVLGGLFAETRTPEGPEEPMDERSGEEIRELRLRSIRDFLKSPIQGWAKYVLHLREESEETLIDKNNEPFETVNPWKTIIPRNSIEEAGLELGTVPPEELLFQFYERKKSRYQQEGKIPAGMFGDVQDLKYKQRLRGWLEQLEDFGPGALKRFRFGSTPQGEHTEGLDAIRFEFRNEERTLERVDLAGDTQVFDPESVSFFHFLSSNSSPDAHKFLRGYLSGIMLQAVDIIESDSFDVVLIQPDRIRARRFTGVFHRPPRDLLKFWASTMLFNNHAYRLPMDVSEDFLDRDGATSGNTFEDDLKKIMMSNWTSSLDEYGPVDDISNYNPPQIEETSVDNTVKQLQRERLKSFWEGVFESGWDSIVGNSSE